MARLSLPASAILLALLPPAAALATDPTPLTASSVPRPVRLEPSLRELQELRDQMAVLQRRIQELEEMLRRPSAVAPCDLAIPSPPSHLTGAAATTGTAPEGVEPPLGWGGVPVEPPVAWRETTEFPPRGDRDD